MLRYTLKNSLTDTKHVEHGKEEWHFQKPTKGYRLRTRDCKRHFYKPIMRDQDSPKSPDSIEPDDEAIALGKLEKVLEAIDAEMVREAREEELNEEKTIEGLVSTMNEVVSAYVN